jgi:polyisoprenoid-binding protein YceI
MTNIDRARVVVFAGGMIAGLAFPSRAQPESSKPAPTLFQIETKKSRLIVETETSGLSSMFAHDHRIEAREFSGSVTFVRQPTVSGALELNVVAASLFLAEPDSTGERQAIESALREDVLETAKYPTISFKTKSAVLERRGDGTYDARLTGELKLHGVKRPMTIPARIAMLSGKLRAIGVFELRQSDFNITPFSFVSGTVAIKDRLTVSFDILAAPAALSATAP